MNKIMTKIIIKKYLLHAALSIIAFFGIFLFFIEKFRKSFYFKGTDIIKSYDYSIGRIIGLILIIVLINIIVRRYLDSKNPEFGA